MRKDTTAESALHLMLLLACGPKNIELPATKLAEFHALSAGGVAKLMQKLTAAGLVIASAGRNGGYKLARPPSQISTLDIVAALDGIVPEFHCREIRRDGVCANVSGHFTSRCTVAAVMDTATQAWRETLRQVSLEDLVKKSAQAVDPKHQAATASWIATNTR
ncbi:transcriptional regulator, BadM/Rrf2 family [Sulfitobacter marinus]|uniref:Transcriptional regulator, BadM/Rrf2 family n=1 Tax=Sulfitobacter marinus TaxID=394264 RepID=A0A1I6V4E3_9RHOB|nr:Rrf2 family transcriptional regulator [Sulfitobacter marinus]SFT08467.1 transcriptional regulator, BadM/Rrf2 family [Sulfitobacter marinus]